MITIVSEEKSSGKTKNNSKQSILGYKSSSQSSCYSLAKYIVFVCKKFDYSWPISLATSIFCLKDYTEQFFGPNIILADNLVNSILAKTEPTSSDGKGLYTFLQACVLLSCKLKPSRFVSVMEKNFCKCKQSEIVESKSNAACSKINEAFTFLYLLPLRKKGHT